MAHLQQGRNSYTMVHKNWYTSILHYFNLDLLDKGMKDSSVHFISPSAITLT